MSFFLSFINSFFLSSEYFFFSLSLSHSFFLSLEYLSLSLSPSLSLRLRQYVVSQKNYFKGDEIDFYVRFVLMAYQPSWVI